MTPIVRTNLSVLYSILICLSIIFTTGCSVTPKPDINIAYVPPMHQVKDFLHEDVVYAGDIYDPLEGFNRRVYTFNYYFDKFLYLPLVKTYEFVMPNFAQDRVSNFVDNIFEFNNFTNNLLQLKFKETGITFTRFVVNSTIGVAGLWDPARKMGMLRQSEDFGQTLGRYGVGNGPFLVLPIFGPSNLRDTTGLVADGAAFTFLGPPEWVDDNDATLIFAGVAAVDKRHRETFRYYRTGSPVEYEMIRLLYTSMRKIQIAK